LARWSEPAAAPRAAELRLVRYADDWCPVVKGTRGDAEALRDEIAGVLAPIGLRLSPAKTLITHTGEGLDFLGWRIQRHRKRGTTRRYVYVYPSKKAVQAVKARIKTLCRLVAVNQPMDELLRRIGLALQGWCGYFRHGVSSAVFAYLSHHTWHAAIGRRTTASTAPARGTRTQRPIVSLGRAKL